MSLLLLEPFGGLAGDMLLAALLDLERPGFDLDALRELAEALVPGECELELREVRRGSLRARELELRTLESRQPPPRGLSELLELVERAPLAPPARRRAGRVLERIAVAEARVHGTTIEAVHFHEVGAVDTLVDVCGAVLALERLGVERVLATPPYAGGGSVRCAHGEMPVPAPGTAALLAGRPWIAGTGGERLTPTGAALFAELSEDAREDVSLRTQAVGYGAGRRDPREGPPNLLRVQLGVSLAPRVSAAEVWQLEFNLDDATGEEVGFLLEELRRAGALEAWSVPVGMKKDRPGVVVSALARGPDRAALEERAFRHSPTLGVRWLRTERTECARETLTLSLDGFEVRVKVRHRPGVAAPTESDLSPEHDDLARVARETGGSLRELEGQAVRLAAELLRGRG